MKKDFKRVHGTDLPQGNYFTKELPWGTKTLDSRDEGGGKQGKKIQGGGGYEAGPPVF